MKKRSTLITVLAGLALTGAACGEGIASGQGDSDGASRGTVPTQAAALCEPATSKVGGMVRAADVKTVAEVKAWRAAWDAAEKVTPTPTDKAAALYARPDTMKVTVCWLDEMTPGALTPGPTGDMVMVLRSGRVLIYQDGTIQTDFHGGASGSRATFGDKP